MSWDYSDQQGGTHEAPQESAAAAGPPRHEQPAPPRHEQPPAPRRRRPMLTGCLIAFLATVGVLGLLLVCVILLFGAAVVGAAGSMGQMAMPSEQVAGVGLREVTMGGDPKSPKVAVVPVRGLLMPGGRDGAAGDPAHVLKAMLAKARDDDEVRAVILAVDSGGGGVTTSDVMRQHVLAFKHEARKPVIVLMGDVCASGAYFLSCPADYIMAHPTTVTGSIGVMWPFFDASELMGNIGVRERTITSGDFKNMTSPFTERTEEEWAEQKQVIEDVVVEMHGIFVRAVAEGRGMDVEAVEKLADGRVFTSKQALENGLIDGEGYMEDALDEARRRAGMRAGASVHLVAYQRAVSVFDLLLAKWNGPGINVQVGGELKSRLRSRPMYLWQPPAPPGGGE